MSPAIIIPVYQKSESLQRLLDSLRHADYGDYEPLLILSLENGATEAVKKIVDTFVWPFGEKKILYRSGKASLDRHILECADRSMEYGTVILLEDDSFVSKYFYLYAAQASQYYSDDLIAQISLYSYPFNEISAYPFIPLKNGSDVYLLRKPCSRGQVWTARQWAGFREFMERNQAEYERSRDLPERIMGWDHGNWERMFSWYLIRSGRYVLYPYHSLCTMFGDLGVHVRERRSRYSFQVPLFAGAPHWKFVETAGIALRYDEYFEIDPHFLKAGNPALNPYDFTVDLNGSKAAHAIKNDLLLTCRSGRGVLLSYGRELRPAELNVLYALPGKELVLTEAKNVIFKESFLARRRRKKSELLYHYPEYPRRF